MEKDSFVNNYRNFFFYLLVGLIIISFPIAIFFLGIKYQQGINAIKSKNFNNTSISEKNNGIKNDTCMYGFVPRDNYLDVYTVEKGDSLSSIAKSQLGSTNKAEQIIALNVNKNPSLVSISSFLEVGWELYLPPKNLPESKGEITGLNGKLIKKNSSSWDTIYTDNPTFPIPIIVTDKTVFLDDKPFNDGDCIRMIIGDMLQQDGSYLNVLLAVSHQYE